jgi:hypothetical protein
MGNPKKAPKTRAISRSGTERAPKSAPPPAPKGNRRGLRHGAHAQVLPARLDAVTAAIAAQIAADAPVRAPSGELPAHDREVVVQLARCLCRLDDVGRWLDEHGSLDRRGKVRSAALWERRLRGEALRYLDALGMTPRSRAKLGLDLARTVDLATAMSEPDPRKREQLLREAGVGGGDVV